MRPNRWYGAVVVVLAIAACGGQPPRTLGVVQLGTLPPCPATPNCVHTGMRHPEGTEPILLRTDIDLVQLMSALRDVVEAFPRTTVTTTGDNYLRAEAKSRIFRFIDDLELLVAADRELIVRSASRVGRGDMGVNGRRVDQLRDALGEAGLLREP